MKIPKSILGAAFAVALALPLTGCGESTSLQRYDAKQKEFDAMFVESEKPITATVLEEKSSMELIKDKERVYSRGLSSGMFLSRSVSTSGTVPVERIELAYVIKAEREDNGKIISIYVVSGPQTKKEALEALVEPGCGISFPSGNMVREGENDRYAWVGNNSNLNNSMCWHGYRTLNEETAYGPDTQVGSKFASRIKVLPKTEVVPTK